jgi:enhancing lycopene biosynthesis protein 2
MTENPRRVAVVLSGCGYLDGAEINEAVATLYHLARQGAEYQCYAPDRDFPEYDHITGQPTGASRNALREAARIARGKVAPLAKLDPSAHEAIIFVGGFGAARNLSTFAADGPGASALPEVVSAARAFRAASKPIGVECIAPAMLAVALKGDVAAKVTVGAASGASEGVEALGFRHEPQPVTGLVVDEENRIVSTPAYMYGQAPITGPFEGIGKLVDAVLAMTRG